VRAPRELRVSRASYADPVVATQVRRGPDRRLPEGLVSDFSGLPEFAQVTLVNGTGEIVYDQDATFCPGAAAARAFPAAPATTPYPAVCTGNPFALGAVWGIPAGWGSPLVSEFLVEHELTPGTYTATVSISSTYRELFRIPNHAASAMVEVEVAEAEIFPPLGTAGVPPARPEPGVAARPALGDKQGTPTAPRASMLLGAAGNVPGQWGQPALETTILAHPSVPQRWRPDLRALPAWDISVGQDLEGVDRLQFATTIWNAGRSPLVVEGFRRSGTEILDSYQFFYDRHGQLVGSVPAGFPPGATRVVPVRWPGA
jgi:hypothetical protein